MISILPIDLGETGIVVAPVMVRRVMIVEDEFVIAMLLSELLEGLGHEICAIEDTEIGAVNAARLHAPDLMIVDAQLREGSGIQAVRAILRLRAIPHLFVSGGRIQGISPNAVMLQKPFREADLVRAIERALIVH